MKTNEFARFFKPWKSPQPNVLKGILPKHPKRYGRLVWNAFTQGTYVRSLHGELK